MALPILTITAIQVGNFKNAEHVQFHTNVRNEINVAGAETMGLPQAVYMPYLQAIAKEQDIVNRAQASVYTKDMEVQDAIRSQNFRLVRRKLDLVNYMADSSAVAALRDIVNIALLGKYSTDVARLPYQEKSATITGFVQDCRTLLTSAQVKSLGIDDDLDELEANNQRFGQLYQERVDERAQAELALTATLRSATDNAYKLIVVTINGLANLVDPSKTEQIETTRACVDRINQIIKEAKQTLNARLGKTNDVQLINGEEPEYSLPIFMVPAENLSVAGKKLVPEKVKMSVIKQIDGAPALTAVITMTDFVKAYGGRVVSSVDEASGLTTLVLEGWTRPSNVSLTLVDVF